MIRGNFMTLLVGFGLLTDLIGQTHETVTFRYDGARSSGAVFVLGDLPELGSDDMTRAIQLIEISEDRWEVDIALPVNRDYAYRFYERSVYTSTLGNPSNGTAISEPLSASTSTVPLSPATKSLSYRGNLETPLLHWRQSPDTVFQSTVLSVQADWWVAPPLGERNLGIEFYFTDGTEREPASLGGVAEDDPVYSTKLDTIYVQNSELFSYQPQPTLSPPRRDYDAADLPTVDSIILNEARPYRVYLPRGYDQQTDRYYPVILFQDGQGLFEEDRTVDGSVSSPKEALDPDGAVLNELIATGQMHEVIAIGVDALSTADRLEHYVPLGDITSNRVGEAKEYADFVWLELLPHLQTRYRILAGPENTGAVGYRLGGLLALYLGWDYATVFGRVGALSFEKKETFLNAMTLEPNRDIHLYLDSGTNDFAKIRDLRNVLLSKSTGRHVVNGDFLYQYAFNQANTTENYRTRLPQLLPFLFPAEEERDTSGTNAARPYWLQHFGLTHADWLIDLDGDGYDTLSEYQFGTDPLDQESHLDVSGEYLDDSSLINWQSQLGVPVCLDLSADLTLWQAAGAPIMGTGEVFEAMIPFEAGTDPDRLFYRIRAMPPTDTDRDGLTDVEESLLLGTDIHRQDTDNDSFDDGLEVLTMGTDPLVPNTTGGSISGTVSFDADENAVVAGDPLAPGIVVFIDLNYNGIRDLSEPFQMTDEAGTFTFPNIAPGSYHVRQELGAGWIQTFPGGIPETPNGLPDTIVAFDHSGEGPFPQPYGILADDWEVPFIDVGKPVEILDPAILLKPIGARAATPPTGVMSTTEFVSVSKNSSVTVKFENEEIIDGPGYDLQLVTVGASQYANETAELYVGATVDDLIFIGVSAEYGNIGIDLDRFGINHPIQYVRLKSLTNAGTAPGFDLVGFEAIHYKPASNDHHLVRVTENEDVTGVHFGRLGRDLPPSVFLTNETSSVNAGDPITVFVSGTDDLGTPAITLTANGSPVVLDENGRATITPAYPGDLLLTAKATDSSGQVSSKDVLLAIRNADGSLPDVPGSPSLEELAAGAPSISVASPGAGKVLVADTSVIATITSPNVSDWQLHYAPVDLIDPYHLSAVDPDYQLIAQGNGAVIHAPLGDFPATSLPDGIYFLRVSASSGGVTAYSGHTIGVRVDDSELFPQISITEPSPNDDITYLTDLVGSITSTHSLREWYIEVVKFSEIDPVNLANRGSAQYRRIAEGTNAMPIGSVLATFDPTLLPNDQYLLKVTAWNELGLGWTEGVIINTGGNAKLGRLRTEYTDLQIDLAGVPIEIKRTYDSFDTDESGDFGHGWRIGYANPELNETVPDNGATFATKAYQDGTRVYLNSPDGRRIGFTFRLEEALTTFFGTSYRAVFEPDPGVYDTLSVLEGDGGFLSQADNGDAVISLIGLPYNPDTFILTTKEGMHYTYHETEGLVDIADDNGNQLIFTENGIRHSSGVSADFTRDAEGRITQITGPDGGQWVYAYTANGDLDSVTDPAGVTVTFTYHSDPAHYLDKVIDPLGRTGVQYEYDSDGRLVATIDENGNRSEESWDLGAFSGTLSNYRGDVTTIHYDARGNITQEVDPLGATTQFVYGDSDHPDLETSVTDPRGHATTYQYDERGNRTRLNPPTGNRTDWEYNEANRITKLAGPNLRTDTYTYNENHQVSLHNVGGNDEIAYTYADDGSVASQTSVEGVFTSYRYGGTFGQLDEIQGQDGHTARLNYAADGLPAALTNTYGGQSTYTFDDAGRLLEEEDPYGNATTITLVNGELSSSVSRGGLTTTYQFNASNQLTQESIGGATSSYTFDPDGNQTSVTDPLGNTTTMAYDAKDQLVLLTDANGNSITHVYDLAGNRTQTIDRLGRKRTFIYDAMNRMTAERWHDPSDDSVFREIIFEYNKFQRLSTVTDGALLYEYQSLGSINVTRLDITFPGLAKRNVSYFYENISDLDRVSTSDARYEYTRDSRGNVALIVFITPDTTVTARLEIERVNGGLPQQWRRFDHKFGGSNHFIGSTNFTWDLTGQPMSISYLDELDVSLSLQGTHAYTRNAERHLASHDDGLNVATYAYGGQGQLAAVTNSSRADESYPVDLNGNRTANTVSPGNRVTAAGDYEYDWDAEGNLIQRRHTGTGEVMDLTWDFRNRLEKVEIRPSAGAAAVTTVAYQYDHRDLQIGRTVAGETTWTYYGLNEMPYFEFLGTEATPSAVYFHDPDTTDRFYGEWREGQGVRWFLTDHLDSVRQITDGAGNVVARLDYDAFGNLANLTGDAGKIRFAGRLFDEDTGFYYNRARYYDPALGRFISEDPLMFESGDNNLYRYASNNPANFTDPSGNSAASDYAFTVKIAKRARKYGQKVGEQIYDCFMGIAESLENASQGKATAGDTSECSKWPGIQ